MAKNSRKLLLTALLALLFLASARTLMIAHAAQIVIQLEWFNPMLVHDVAVSDDGNYLAAVNNTGLHYFDADSSTPLWWYQPSTTFLSVAISGDGDYVVAGDNEGILHYFNQSRARTDEQTEPTWTSIDLGGPIEKGTLDMSSNGNFTVVGGTGTSIWYFADCHKRAGADNMHTWTSGVGSEFYTVHISANGRYVAGGGAIGFNGFVVFYENATTMSGYVSPKWFAHSQLPTHIIDLALSNDGYAVAAVDVPEGIGTLYYWANATKLTGDPNATWTDPGSFWRIDMSGNGDTVVAGGIYYTSVHFWSNARTRTDIQSEDWVRLETVNVYDISISTDGNLMAVPTMNMTGSYLAYFLTSDGAILNDFVLPQFTNMVSMSDLGETIAMAGPGYDSLYVFKATIDSKPPDINQVTQNPDKDSVHPDTAVEIFANVTDELSGVKQVILNYTTGNGTWFTQIMNPYSTDIFNGTIPAFPYCTTVTYIIIAEDNANNTITTAQLELDLQYHVIPEFTTAYLMLTFMAMTILYAAASRRKKI
ncbi:MAG: hypothetical protein QHH24_06210 [Candidatus Bathyarchaeota archaeon]|nr:hypothetical protein [Candidatus Bathyarchaeota archaeon]